MTRPCDLLVQGIFLIWVVLSISLSASLNNQSLPNVRKTIPNGSYQQTSHKHINNYKMYLESIVISVVFPIPFLPTKPYLLPKIRDKSASFSNTLRIFKE